MSKKKTKFKWIWGVWIAVALAIAAALTGAIININIENGKVNASIIYSDENVAPEVSEQDEIDKVESGQGEILVDGQSIPTVEAVDNNGPVVEVEDEDECAEGEECGRGAAFPKVNVSSPQAFANDTLGVCIDVDGHYGAQCWDSMDAFFLNYANRAFSTCGSGAAKGTIANGCWQKNAGNEFVMIWDKTKVQPGDIAVFSTGTWGHTGMIMGYYNNGYFTLLGQNQGGKSCPGGGAAGNIINISARDFIGAFRPKSYIKPEPKPTPTPKPTPKPVTPTVDKCKTRTVAKGETMGKIMKECRGKITWGAAMNDYANHWWSTKVNPGKTVYYGWTHGTGYGLFAGDTIEYRN